MPILHLSKKSFRSEVIENNGTVIVDFFADWCSPCRALAPVMEEISDELNEQCTVYKVDVDQDQDLASEYSVTAIPTVIIFKNGKEVNRTTGVRSKDYYVDVAQNSSKLD